MQAAIITSYKNFDQLFFLVKKLLGMQFKIFIHIDKKTFDESNEYIELLNKTESIYLISKYSISWGSINHLYSILDLLQIATTDKDVHFIHIISSQDYPIKTQHFFDSFFSTENNCIYMTVTGQEKFNLEVKDRYAQFYFFQQSDSRKSRIQKIDTFSQKIQKMIGIERKRFGSFTHLYKGMVWISAPKHVFIYTLSFYKARRSFSGFLYFCRIPEEFFFQTILSNSNYAKYIIPDNLRFTFWEEKYSSIPAILDESDFGAIQNSNAVFARKVDPLISKILMKKIDKNLL
jgi:hypothetical protein